MFGYCTNFPIKTSWHLKASIQVLQEMPKNQHKKPMGILDAPCVGITKSPQKTSWYLRVSIWVLQEMPKNQRAF